MGAMRDEEGRGVAAIREYNPETDRDGTEAVDRECDVGPAGGMSLHADLLGDPVARIRHSPHYLMLVRTCVLRPTSDRSSRSCTVGRLLFICIDLKFICWCWAAFSSLAAA